MLQPREHFRARYIDFYQLNFDTNFRKVDRALIRRALRADARAAVRTFTNWIFEKIDDFWFVGCHHTGIFENYSCRLTINTYMTSVQKNLKKIENWNYSKMRHIHNKVVTKKSKSICIITRMKISYTCMSARCAKLYQYSSAKRPRKKNENRCQIRSAWEKLNTSQALNTWKKFKR